MREGYKETKIGFLPKDWDVAKQSDVATFFNGRAYKLTEWETKGTPVIRLQNLTGNGKEFYYSNLKLPNHQYCYKGDLLYMWSATFGPVWWSGDKAIYHYHIWKIEHDPDRIDKSFHYYLLDNVTTRMKNESHGSTMLHVTKGGMEKLLIQIPPLPEQQKIASILSTVDDKIDSIDQRISETQQLKKGLMQKLLTGQISVADNRSSSEVENRSSSEVENRSSSEVEMKDSVLGKIPVSWEVVELEALIDPKRPIRYGIVQTGENLEDGIPCIRVVDFNRRDFNKQVMIKTSPEISKLYQTTILEEGDIVFPLRGKIGAVKLINENAIGANLTRGIALISNSKKINSTYLLWQIRSTAVRKLIELEVNGTTLKEIPIGGLKKVLIPIASNNEQQKIASILSTVDEKLEVLADKKTQYQELKKGLMQVLLTGKVRVKV